MVRLFSGHRFVPIVPIVLIGLVTLVGGWLNGVDIHGRVVDDFTDQGIPKANIIHGARTAVADDTGTYSMTSLPRESSVILDAPGYLRTGVAVSNANGDTRVTPLSFTIQLNEKGNATKFIASAQVRQGTTVLGTTNDGGNTVISPHPGKDAKLLICAASYDQLEITVHGVAGTFELTPGTNACPPLPTPSPTPTPAPTASPSGSPGASPAPTPSPTGSP